MYRLGRADDTAPAAGRGQRITQKILGVFLNRRADWIRDALACRNLVESNRELDPVLSTLRALHKNNTKLGMKRLKILLQEAVDTQTPAVLQGAEVDVDFELESEEDSGENSSRLSSSGDEDVDNRRLLGLRRRATAVGRAESIHSSDRDGEGEEAPDDDTDEWRYRSEGSAESWNGFGSE